MFFVRVRHSRISFFFFLSRRTHSRPTSSASRGLVNTSPACHQLVPFLTAKAPSMLAAFIFRAIICTHATPPAFLALTPDINRNRTGNGQPWRCASPKSTTDIHPSCSTATCEIDETSPAALAALGSKQPTLRARRICRLFSNPRGECFARRANIPAWLPPFSLRVLMHFPT